MEELWVSLEHMGFDNYSVSDHGHIRNDLRCRMVSVSLNQQGLPKVSMIRHPGEGQITLGVAKIVATTFVERPFDNCDSVINLDGDRTNCHMDNLAWRPRWYSIAYHNQFDTDEHVGSADVICNETGEIFRSCRQAAVFYGILEKDIMFSASNGRKVWPYGYTFDFIDRD